VYISAQSEIKDIPQLLATETLTFCMKKDYTYAIFSPYHGHITNKTQEILERQGFQKIKSSTEDRPVYVVDMKTPIVIFQNLETVLKAPFDSNERVQETLQKTHRRLQ